MPRGRCSCANEGIMQHWAWVFTLAHRPLPPGRREATGCNQRVGGQDPDRCAVRLNRFEIGGCKASCAAGGARKLLDTPIRRRGSLGLQAIPN